MKEYLNEILNKRFGVKFEFLFFSGKIIGFVIR